MKFMKKDHKYNDWKNEWILVIYAPNERIVIKNMNKCILNHILGNTFNLTQTQWVNGLIYFATILQLFYNFVENFVI